MMSDLEDLDLSSFSEFEESQPESVNGVSQYFYVPSASKNDSISQ